jgi:hypothetical protein
MEALNSLIREANRCAALMPLPGRAIVHRHASLYVDDLVVLLAPLESDLECLHYTRSYIYLRVHPAW